MEDAGTSEQDDTDSQDSNISYLQTIGGSPGDVSENPVTQEKRKKGWRMSCDVGEATEGLDNELGRR